MSTGSTIISGNTSWAFDAYQAVRHRLPQARFPERTTRVPDMDALADHFDVFLLDAFGVLNIGENAIPGVVDRVAGLRARVEVRHHAVRRFGQAFNAGASLIGQ